MSSYGATNSALLPDRHPQGELFICDIADCVLKNDLASMEHPIFALSKRPDLDVRNYRYGDVTLTVVPSVRGLATIYDKDVLIFAISQLMAAKNAGRRITRTIKLSARACLIFTNRHTGGKDYAQLESALDRLSGTRLRTTISTGGIRQDSWFGLIESANIERDEKTGRIRALEMTLSKWLFNAIDANEVLSMHRDYFRLRGATSRRLYEIVRKHCGNSAVWSIGLEKLYRKSGSRSHIRQFRYELKAIASNGSFLGYQIQLELSTNLVHFRNLATTPNALQAKRAPAARGGNSFLN